MRDYVCLLCVCEKVNRVSYEFEGMEGLINECNVSKGGLLPVMTHLYENTKYTYNLLTGVVRVEVKVSVTFLTHPSTHLYNNFKLDVNSRYEKTKVGFFFFLINNNELNFIFFHLPSQKKE